MFQNIKELIAENQINKYQLIPIKDAYYKITVVDNKGLEHQALVQYYNNQIYAPEAPHVICLKGRRDELEADLSHAPANMLYIGRNLNMGGWRLSKSKWANPYSVKKYGRDKALRLYGQHILNTPELLNAFIELTGKTLACWCAPQPCHGHVLRDLYNTYFIGNWA